MDESHYESDEDQHKNERMVKIREAEANENVRLKSLQLKRKMAAMVGSPLGSSRKAQASSKRPAEDSLGPMPKRNRNVDPSRRVEPVPSFGWLGPDDLNGDLSYLDVSRGDEDVIDRTPVRIEPDTQDKSRKADGVVKDTYTIPRKEKTSSILPQKFWPSEMTAGQIDKLTVDQVHALKKLELDEKTLKKENDLPGLVMKPTELYLPEVVVKGGTHDFIKKIVPGSMLHFPIGPPDDWWEHVPIEWKTVTGTFNYSIYFSS